MKPGSNVGLIFNSAVSDLTNENSFSALGKSNEDSLSKVKSYSAESTQQEAVIKLITRVIGNRSNDFHVTVNPQILNNGKDVFTVSYKLKLHFFIIEVI